LGGLFELQKRALDGGPRGEVGARFIFKQNREDEKSGLDGTNYDE
jgi:hypothetical protein